MTIAEMHSWFKLMLDKWDTPYYTNTEIDTFINRAMNNWVNQNVFVRREEAQGLVIKSASEFSLNWEMLVYPLIVSDISVTTTASSSLLFTDIVSGLPVSTSMLALLELRDPSNNAVEWIRHNNFGAENRNVFTAPSSEYRKYRVDASRLIISPASSGEVYKASILRTPVPVSLSTPTNCELPVSAHEKIITMAVDLAKFPTNDESVGGLSQNTV